MTLPGERRPLEEYVAARFEAELAPKAIARLEELVTCGDRRALALLERVERERLELLDCPRPQHSHS